ncbi:hypothetical protein RI129_009609 [Pyrocoelia pectoralis]|uniref:Myb/SANT-like DNA-binding domain-containing protein n=1 Tax=Pyrocoelia pectoralis TaxID=417401 RepID=A0AAN7ZFY6_9COLE
MFVKIAEDMQTFGYTYSGEQVKNRWRCFEKSYKTYMQHNNKLRGRERRTLEFEEQLHGIFHKEPQFYPEVVTSSDKTRVNPAVAISVSTKSERRIRSESAKLSDSRINHGRASSSTVTVDPDNPSPANKKTRYTYKATSTVLEGIRVEMKLKNDLKEKQVELQKKHNELLEKKLTLLEKHTKTSY